MISKEDVIHIAKLARLELTEKETEKMQKDLSSILDYFNLLKKAPKFTKGKQEDKTQIETTTREDKIIEKPASLANNLVQSAPDTQERYIKVKNIF